MRILVFTQGRHGERILENIIRRAPGDWSIHGEPLPLELPSMVDDPERVVSGLDIPGEWELVLFLGEGQPAFSLLPAMAKRLSARAVIAPVEDYNWLPLGMERQLRSELKGLGLGSAFPRPFCALLPVGIPIIDEFAMVFGSPLVKLDVKGDVVKSVEVLRGAPCGSTWYMAERLRGERVDHAEYRASILVQIYPCLASRKRERLLGDAPIHVAGRLARDAVKNALKT